MTTSTKTLALLIDGDNARLTYSKQIIQFCSTYGNIKIKRAYGDWKHPPLSSHQPTMLELGIKRVQQDRVGKNATDFKLAMDVALLLDKGAADIYVLASGDGDFTTVCMSIRQRGAKVIGIGVNGTSSSSLRKSCNHFFYLKDILNKPQPPLGKKQATKTLNVLLEACRQSPQNEGWVYLADVGTVLSRIDQKFDRRFANQRLSTWLKRFPQQFELDRDRVRLK